MPTASKKKAATPRKRAPKPKPRPWTEVEDYFLGGHLGTLAADAIAAKLGRTAAEVAARVAELGWGQKAARAGRDKALAGFVNHPTGAVSMSESRSMAPAPEPRDNPRYRPADFALFK
jgi:hypothetical protein